MSDQVVEQVEDEDDDEGLPLFWGFLLVAAVTGIAVWLFGLFPDADSAVTTTTTVAAEAATTSTTAAVEEPEPAPETIVDLLEADGRFATLLGLLDRTGLSAELESSGPFTLFAPTDEALSGVDVPDDDEAIRSLLLRHVVAGGLDSGAVLAADGGLEALSGDFIRVSAEPVPSVGGAAIVEADLAGSNGLVHVVAAPVLDAGSQTAQTLADDGRFGTLLTAVEVAGVGDALAGPVTVLAPTDEAFASLPAGVVDRLLAEPDRLAALLGYHVVPGTVGDVGSYASATGEELEVGAGDVNGVSIADRLPPNVIALDGVLVPGGFVLADINDILDLAPITFQVGSAVITPEGQAELDRAVEYLTENPVAIEIGGHTDSDGSDEANLALSEQRAQAVVDYLSAGGVDPALLTAVGYGEAQPIADNETEEGRAQNRRIEFSILG